MHGARPDRAHGGFSVLSSAPFQHVQNISFKGVIACCLDCVRTCVLNDSHKGVQFAMR